MYGRKIRNLGATYKWVIQKEVIERSEGGAMELEPPSVAITILSDKNGELRFVTPAESGEYRLFSLFLTEIKKWAQPIYRLWLIEGECNPT